MDVKSAGRTVDLFEVFAKAQSPLTLSEIARAIGAPQSSCFNLIQALQSRGYVYAVGGSKRLYPTRKLAGVAQAIAAYEPVVPRVEPALEALRDETLETVIFGARQGRQVVYLAVAEGPQTIRYMSHAGSLKPLHASAIGKALLMAMKPAERTALVAKIALPRATSRTIVTAKGLLDDIARAEKRGYAQTRGEHVADVMAVARPVRIDGAVYAVAVAGPITRVGRRATAYARAIAGHFADLADSEAR